MFYILFRCTIVISNRLYKFFERIRDGGRDSYFRFAEVLDGNCKGLKECR